MAMMRVLPPPSGPNQTMTVHGRSYSAAPGNTLDVPDFDAQVLMANGWTLVGLVGTTAQRPSGPLPRSAPVYIDTSVNKPIFHDGQTYRDHQGNAT